MCVQNIPRFSFSLANVYESPSALIFCLSSTLEMWNPWRRRVWLYSNSSLLSSLISLRALEMVVVLRNTILFSSLALEMCSGSMHDYNNIASSFAVLLSTSFLDCPCFSFSLEMEMWILFWSGNEHKFNVTVSSFTLHHQTLHIHNSCFWLFSLEMTEMRILLKKATRNTQLHSLAL